MIPHSIAVVVPTYNRCKALKQCIEHLERQTYTDFEVVIVDDGSTDSTAAWVSDYLEHTSLSLRYLSQKNSGPARARNFAVSVIDAPITVLIGDDIFPSPQFTARHAQLHEERPEASVVGLGLTVWDDQDQQVTPFMRWLDTHGMQFGFGELLAGVKPSWKHFYTSNLSIKTTLLRAFPFNESFRYAAMEDIEAACRIDVEHGLDMVFLPDALACHLHPMSFSNACRRMEKVGESAAYFDELWPGKLPRGPRSLISRLAHGVARAPFAAPVLEAIANQSLEIACPNRLMQFVLNRYFEQGYERHLRMSEKKQPLVEPINHSTAS